jgi:hypothetical protein
MTYIINKQSDLLLVKFPIIFPILYGIILYFYPSYENLLIFFTILLLAEPHFGATWPFFLSKKNINFVSTNKLFLIYLPGFVFFFSVIGFFFFNRLFLLIFFAFNIYHVTRQSFGIIKLYEEKNEETSYQKSVLYFFNIIFFFVGYFRFYYPLIKNEHLLFLNFFIIFLFFFVIIFNVIKFRNLKNLLSFITGIIIFYPICFVANPVHAILMGVTMHYSQYLIMTYKVVKKRETLESFNFNLKFIFFIICYGIIMTFLSFLGKFSDVDLKSLLVIPITFQMLHFYLDSRLWKFSFQHNREYVLKYLKENW